MENTKSVLWTKKGFIENKYIYCEDLENLKSQATILSLSLYLEAAQKNLITLHSVGVFIKSDEDIEELLPYLETIPLIVLDIPIFSDGRAYSKAARLKTRYQYSGEIRARGNILIDQISNLLRSGFDTLEISHDLTKKRLENLDIVNFPGFYQPGQDLTRTGIFRRFLSN